MSKLTGKVGFASPISEKAFSKQRSGVELFATLALVISLVIAAVAVSVGMVHTHALHGVGSGRALAALIGAMMAGMGGVTAIAARGPNAAPKRVPSAFRE